MSDLIANQTYAPSFDEITGFIQPPTRGLWQDFNNHLQTQYKSSAKITYSTCSAKPGWNIKYQKSGKSLCTLYPEKECFTALIVLPVDLVEEVEQAENAIHPMIVNMARSVKPLNGGIWLMIAVADRAVLESVKKIIALKLANR